MRNSAKWEQEWQQLHQSVVHVSTYNLRNKYKHGHLLGLHTGCNHSLCPSADKWKCLYSQRSRGESLLPADRYTAMNCSWPRMFTMLEEKLHKTYIFAAMWNKEKWLNVDSNIGEQRTFEAGLDVKYLIIVRCREGTLHKQNTNTFAAMIPVTVRWPSLRLFHHLLISFLKSPSFCGLMLSNQSAFIPSK